MHTVTRNIVVLGSTGSIGQQTLDIVRNSPDLFNVLALAGGDNTELLAAQINEFHPRLIYSKSKINNTGNASILTMEEMACHPEADLIVIATAGKAGLYPALAAAKSGKIIALANKEVLVMAGSLVMEQVKKYGSEIRPVDSEHSAIWQCLKGEKTGVSRLILTASGGPFYKYTSSQLNTITVEQALSHPTWKMGKKITIDSATLINKGLEAIEAHWLFSSPYEKIDIVIHPQSIIHSMVEFPDGSIIAQLGYPDMRLPIQYALTYPERLSDTRLQPLDFSRTKSLEFEQIDYKRFPCLKIAIEAGKRGDTYPSVLCAADEVAVELFLSRCISFANISDIISETINLHHPISNPTLEDIMSADDWARKTASMIASKRSL